MNPSVLIGDELYAGLDEKNSLEIKRFLSEALPKDTIYIEATHDFSPENMARFDWVYLIKNGKIVGSYSSSDSALPKRMLMSSD